MKPILFSTEMVRAILDGRKTQTRRIIYHQPISNEDWGLVTLIDSTAKCDQKNIGKHYWVVMKDKFDIYESDERYFLSNFYKDDILYVRETWAISSMMEYFYKANGDEKNQPSIKWKPSIHMPKEAARIFLKVTGVRAERLQDITEADAIAEGIESGGSWELAPSIQFQKLWQSVYGIESWDANPWVWVYTFERIEKPSTL